MNSRSAADHGTAALPATGQRAAAILSAVLALAFGAFLVYGTGFANPTTIHNAAHDARHAIAFPCH